MDEMEENEVLPLKKDLSALDIEFIKVMDELIYTLLSNDVLHLTDLPRQALNKINQRKIQIVEKFYNLICDGEFICNKLFNQLNSPSKDTMMY